MADIHRLPDQEQVLREASEWIARLQGDEATSADRARFEVWRGAHAMHGQAFDQLAGTLDRFVAVRHLVHAVAFGQSIGEVTACAGRTTPAARSSWRPAAWAAVAMVAIVGCGWLAHLLAPAGHVYTTAIGEHASISLPDGSTMELDSNTRARVDFSPRQRVVHLERGEAFFSVAHEAPRPFWVLGGGVWVRDVGTAFNVDLRSNAVRVTVSQGQIKVGAIDPLLGKIPFLNASLPRTPALSELTAGQEADFHGPAMVVQSLTSSALTRAVSWRTGTLYFEDQPLSAVVDELRSYTPLTLVVPQASLRNLSIAGTFKTNPQGVASFLVMLQQGLGLTVQRQGNRVLIERPEASPRP
jgi:transmembrane sensor